MSARDMLRGARYRLLTINSGSSSLKISLFRIAEDVSKTVSGAVTGIGANESRIKVETAYGELLLDETVSSANHPAALESLFAALSRHIDLGSVSVIGHRIVHGGPHYTKAERLTPSIEADLRKLIPMAPLHMPANLDCIFSARQRYPDALHYACFDTSFHNDMPDTARRTGLPLDMEDLFVRRFGFHGISYAYIIDDLAARAGDEASKQRLLVAHLGAGASMAAIMDRKSVDTSMGFSALSGLLMATRSGDIDPGLLLYLIIDKGWDPVALRETLYHEAGLFGLSGLSDAETLLKSDAAAARQALAQFNYQARKQAGALIAVMGGIDRIIFTGGIGENAPTIRAAICEPLGDLYGIRLDAKANDLGETRISASDSFVIVETIPTDEATMIARYGRALVASDAA